MYNKYLALLLPLILLGFSSNAKPKSLPGTKNYQQFDLNKKVKSMKVSASTADGKPSDFTVDFYFDQQGMVEKEVIYDLENHNKVMHTIRYEYDVAKGTAAQYCTDEENEQVWKKLYAQEKDGSVRIKIFKPWTNELTGDKVFEAMLNEQTWSKENNKLVFRNYLYNIDKLVTQRLEKQYPWNNDIASSIDEIGNDQIEYVWLNQFVADYRDAKNNKTRTVSYKLGKQTLEFKKNHITRKMRYDANDKVLADEVYTYEFDNNGNWTKLSTSLNGQPSLVITREITYR